MVETLPENGAFLRAVSLEARILDSETEEIAVAEKPDQQIWLTRACADSPSNPHAEV